MNRLVFSFLGTFLAALPGSVSASVLAPPPPPGPGRPRLASAEENDSEAQARRIRVLLQNLGSAFPAVRRRAEKELLEFGSRAVPALREAATGSPKPVVRESAARILEEILKSLILVVDALGKPISGATIELYAEGSKSFSAKSDACGLLPRPEAAAMLRHREAKFSHEEYGHAVGEFEVTGEAVRLQVPVTRKGTPEHERTLKGVVVDPEGRPVPGARIRCAEVRTPGEGLINPAGAHTALSDEEGAFAIYPPNRDQEERRGDLIPPDSGYILAVEPPPEADLFPHAGRYSNLQKARIRLERPVRHFTLKFEKPDGGYLSQPEQLQRVSMRYRGAAQEQGVILGSRYALTGGGKLLPGNYTGRYGDLDYEPIEVTVDTPAEITFRFPQPVVFQGRVVDGVSGLPMTGAFVIAFSSVGHNNLALLATEDWERLRALPTRPALQDPALEVLRGRYSVMAVARTDNDGRYDLEQEPGTRFPALLAFTKDSLPFRQRTQGLEVDGTHRAAVPDMPLFPAAKVLVHPIFRHGRLSVSPRWLISDRNPPHWMDRFLAAEKPSAERSFEYVHWLKLNEVQPLHVPAGIRLQVEFRVPYDDSWCCDFRRDEILLSRGESLDIGEITFAPTLPVQVRVVDSRGNPIEGVPVRRKHETDDGWGLAHNTDARGLAAFHVKPGSRGHFRVGAARKDWKLSGSAKHLTISFRVGDKVESDQPYEIRMTDEQIEQFLGRQALKR